MCNYCWSTIITTIILISKKMNQMHYNGTYHDTLFIIVQHPLVNQTYAYIQIYIMI